MTKEFVLGIDYGGTKIAAASAWTNGEAIEQTTLRTADYGDAPAVVEAGIRAGRELVAAQTAMGNRIVSVGVSTMGVTYPDKVLMAPNVPGWSELKLGELFARAFSDVSVTFENDVKSAALVELRRGALRDTDYGMYVNLGTGIMVVLTYGEQIMKGHHGASGEIAYNLRSVRDTRGFSDGVAPFEEFVGGRFIGQRGSERFGRTVTAADVFAMYREGDKDAKTFIEETLTELAYHLTNLSNVWNPQKIVFGAGMVSSQDIILPFLNDYFSRVVPFPPELVVARYNRDAALHGAIELAILNQAMQHSLSKTI